MILVEGDVDVVFYWVFLGFEKEGYCFSIDFLVVWVVNFVDFSIWNMVLDVFKVWMDEY